METKHLNANLQENYTKSKCLVDNVNNLTIDIERYICENKGFFDPILIEDCPNSHTGEISIFNDTTFQSGLSRCSRLTTSVCIKSVNSIK